MQSEPSAHRVAEDRVAGRRAVIELAGVDVESGVTQKVPIGRTAEKTVQRDDHAHRSSKRCHTRRLASASGTISITARPASRLLYGRFQIAAQCSNDSECVFSIRRSRTSSDNARSDGTREKMRPPPLLMM